MSRKRTYSENYVHELINYMNQLVLVCVTSKRNFASKNKKIRRKMQQFVLDYRSSKIKDHEICLITFNETDMIGTTQ